jgi:hypothetical protein
VLRHGSHYLGLGIAGWGIKHGDATVLALNTYKWDEDTTPITKAIYIYHEIIPFMIVKGHNCRMVTMRWLNRHIHLWIKMKNDAKNGSVNQH